MSYILPTEFRFQISLGASLEKEDPTTLDGSDGNDQQNENEIRTNGLNPTTEIMTKIQVPQDWIDSFRKDGFVVCPNVLSHEDVDALNDHLEDILRGAYDRGNPPDKSPRLIKGDKPINVDPTLEMTGNKTTKKKKKTQSSSMGPIGFSGNLQNVKVLQVINVHKADSLFRKLETDTQLGNLILQLTGWKEGIRLIQDQIWAKPPGGPSLVFHRDSPYFMFEPDDVITVWVALDDMEEELGPLEYVKGSHLWGDGRIGSANQFFQSTNGGKNLLWSAAEREGIQPEDIEIISLKGLQRGGISIHHGRCWHGSGENQSKSKPRRGLGIHFVPAQVKFTAEAAHSKIWKSYVTNVDDPTMVELTNEDFPITAYS